MIRLVASGLFLTAVICLLSVSIPIGSSQAPPLGAFFNPHEGFWVNARQGNKLNKNINASALGGLLDEVKIELDDRLVPHIFAKNDQDVYFAQGYMTAKHRLWQMDISTRAAVGELSGIIGTAGLENDRRNRRMGMAFASENALKVWKKDTATFKFIEAYAAGVNAYISSLDKNDLPIEYKIMQFEPKVWSPFRTVVFSRTMARNLSTAQRDVEATNTRKFLGDSLMSVLFPTFNKKQVPIFPRETESSTVAAPGQNETIGFLDQIDQPYMINGSEDALRTRQSFLDDAQLGSNNWVLSGAKTANGFALLANDPHLGLTLPSVWYENHLLTPEQNVYGVSLPGIPGVIIGFNDDIAWGTTNAGHDMIDWFKIDWVDEKKQQYWLDGEKIDVENRIEKMVVKGGETVIDTIKYSVWGPIYENGKYADMAMKWLAHQAPKFGEGGAFMRLNKAENFDDFNAAFDMYASPAQNTNFADVNGDIAMKFSGSMPAKIQDQGKYILDGSKKISDWQGYLPNTEVPVSFNPTQGYLASANQVSTDTLYPHYYHAEPYFEDFRGRILNEYLTDMNGATPSDMMALQYNSVNLLARDILPFLLKAVENESMEDDEEKVFDLLSKWDYNYGAKDIAPIYFQLWYRSFYDMVWDEFDVIADSIPKLTPESWRTIEMALETPEDIYFDVLATSDKVESASDVARQSFLESIETFNELEESEAKNWASYRGTRIRHLANLPGFGRKINKSPGWADALNAVSSRNGPSWRMIVELSQKPKAWVVYPGGQSGDPASWYYDNMIDAWESGEYFEPHFVNTRAALKDVTLQTISLKK